MKNEIAKLLQSWAPETAITVTVRFIKRGSDSPLTGSEYMVRLYDRDLFTDDDFLGSSKLNEQGEAHIHFYPSDFTSNDIGLEQMPDLYILLFKDDIVHFQTKVWEDVNLETLSLDAIEESRVLNFGTFLVD